jgi:hypothetical protein
MDGFQKLLAGRLGNPPRRGALSNAERVTGVKSNVIGRWLDPVAPKRPSPKNLEKIAPYLGVDYNDLLRLVYGEGEDGQPAMIGPHDPITPHDQALRSVDVIAAEMASLRSAIVAMSPASQSSHGLRNHHSQMDCSDPYIYQEPVQIDQARTTRPGGAPDQLAA